MKSIYACLIIFLIIILPSSCKECKRSDDTPKDSNVTTTPIDTHRLSGVRMTSNQLIVEFQKDDIDRQELRNKVHATKKSACSCGDGPIELWEINTGLIDIEEAKRQVADNGGRGGVRGDREFIFPIPDPGIEDSTGIILGDGIDVIPRNILNELTIPQTEPGERVNIAVVDTGLDFKKFLSPKTKFLYDTSNLEMNCQENEKYNHISGWNFVSNNGNVADDHSDGHGTFVTKTLIRELKENNIPYSILPIKAFNDNGQGSYWNLVCAINYIKEIYALNEDLHIANISAGYDWGQIQNIDDRASMIEAHRDNSILASLINDLRDKTIFVASAGNNGFNNDKKGQAHFPSDFVEPNIIGVGGYKLIPVSTFGHTIRKNIGNYGTVSIDLTAPYQITFSENIQDIVKEGTSYGTPIATARLAQVMSNTSQNNTLNQIKDMFFLSSLVMKDTRLENKINQGRYITSTHQFGPEQIEAENPEPHEEFQRDSL